MTYLLALLIPLAFLYSPKTEKANIVLVTKALTITQERNTPAYTLYQQSQILQKLNQVSHVAELRKLAQSTATTTLTTESVTPLIAKQESITQPTQVAELKIDKSELVKKTDQQLQTILNQQPESTLIEKPKFSTNAEGAVIRGHFELIEGVGIVDHNVILKRVFEGQSIEIGQVDLKQGLYQIAVGSFEGEIVAEIKDKAGLLVGEDHQKLFQLKRSGSYFDGPTLKLGRPISFALNPRTVDDVRIKKNNVSGSLFSGNYELKKTDDSYPNVSRHSSTLGVIQDKTSAQLSTLNLASIATTLSVRSAGDQSHTVLFSKKWVDGAISYIAEQVQIQFLPETGIIIGRVMMDGQPVAGAQISVENQPGIEPYYLDQFLIPQTAQTTTSANGYFIIPGLNPGSYQISSSLRDRILGNQQYLVEAQILSYQEIFASSIPQNIIARSFDAFTGEIVSTELLVPGQKDLVSLEVEATQFLQNSKYGLSEIINRPLMRDYSPYIYVQSLTKDHLHLPQIKESFIEYIIAQTKIEINSDASIFVGFTPQNHFEVNLADENYDKRHNIVYFDRVGSISSEQVEGGGFIAFNIPEGVQEIILQEPLTQRSFSTVIYSRPSAFFVSHFSE